MARPQKYVQLQVLALIDNQDPSAPVSHQVYQSPTQENPGDPNHASPALPESTGVFMGVLGGVLEFLQTAVIVIVLTFLIRTFVVQPFYIIGSSMEPTLYEGQLLMIDQLSYRLGDPQRGDVVVIHPPHDTVDYIKRIIGTPGDTVVITADGDVMINGQALDEPYLSEANQDTKGQLSISLSEDEYFVLGDNREVSNDSRGGINQLTNRAENPWTIQKEDMVGKALLRWWPLNQFGLIHHPDYEL